MYSKKKHRPIGNVPHGASDGFLSYTDGNGAEHRLELRPRQLEAVLTALGLESGAEWFEGFSDETLDVLMDRDWMWAWLEDAIRIHDCSKPYLTKNSVETELDSSCTPLPPDSPTEGLVRHTFEGSSETRRRYYVPDLQYNRKLVKTTGGWYRDKELRRKQIEERKRNAGEG